MLKICEKGEKKAMFNGLQNGAIILAATLQSLYLTKVRPSLADERGDTNFISILIILGIVVVLAGVFIGLKDQIVGLVQGKVSTFAGTFSGDAP